MPKIPTFIVLNLINPYSMKRLFNIKPRHLAACLLPIIPMAAAHIKFVIIFVVVLESMAGATLLAVTTRIEQEAEATEEMLESRQEFYYNMSAKNVSGHDLRIERIECDCTMVEATYPKKIIKNGAIINIQLKHKNLGKKVGDHSRTSVKFIMKTFPQQELQSQSFSFRRSIESR